MFFKKFKKGFVGSSPVQSVITRSKDTFLPGFHGFSMFEVWSAYILQLRKTSLLERTSAISFNVVMAIPPTLVFLFTLIPYLPISNQFIQELYTVIRDVVPGQQNNTVIIQFLDDFLRRPRNELLSFGLLLALYFSSNAMMGILRSFDKDYEGFEKKKYYKKTEDCTPAYYYFFPFIFRFPAFIGSTGSCAALDRN